MCLKFEFLVLELVRLGRICLGFAVLQFGILIYSAASALSTVSEGLLSSHAIVKKYMQPLAEHIIGFLAKFRDHRRFGD
jgi:hypothetical protein